MDWQMRLDDAISGPAKQMAASLGGLEKAFRRLDTAAKLPGLNAASQQMSRLKMGTSMGPTPRGSTASAPVSTGASGPSAALPMIPGQVGILLELSKAALAAASAVGALGAAFTATVLDTADFLSGTEKAIDMLTKKAGEGSRAMDIAIELSGQFHMNPRTTIESMQGLISKGFGADRAGLVITAMADLKVLSPKANLSAVTLAIEQIQGKGKLQMEELQGQLAEAGLSVSKVIEQLAVKYKKSSDQVRAMISAGKVNATDGIDAIVAAIQGMGSGKLGAAAEQAARSSFSGLVNGIRTSFGLALLQVGNAVSKGPGFKAAKGALGRVLDGLDPNKTPGSKSLITAAGGFATALLTTVFGPLSDESAGATMQKVLSRMAEGVKALTTVVKTVGPIVSAALGGFGEGFGEAYDTIVEVGGEVSKAFGGDREALIGKVATAARGLGKAFGYVAVGVGLAVGVVLSITSSLAALMFTINGGAMVAIAAVGLMVDDIKGKGMELLDAGVSLGTNLWQGFVNGIDAGITAVMDAGTRLADSARTAVGSALEIGSPSKVFEQLGAWTGEGFQQGVDGSAGDVGASMRDLVTPPTPTATAGGGTSTTLAAGGISVTVNVGGAGGDGQGIASEVKAAVMAALEEILGQTGASPAPS
jgi:tape measure domain-containing protein